MFKVLGRALAHCVSAIVILILVVIVARFLGASELLAVGFGVVIALAPGAYDYLGRDIAGRRIADDDPLALEEDPWMWIGSTRFQRPAGPHLNDGDLAYALRLTALAQPEVVELFSLSSVAEWRKLDPESDLAGAVIDTLDSEIDAIPDWTTDQQLPLYGLFLADLREGLLNELGAAFSPLSKTTRLQ